MSDDFDDEMQAALLADAAKLRALGADVADPVFLADIDAIENLDQDALRCAYCGCDRTHPCALAVDSSPFSAEDLRWIERDRRRCHPSEVPDVYPCGWHRIVELVDPKTGAHAGYFAVCTNAMCVRAHLADGSAP